MRKQPEKCTKRQSESFDKPIIPQLQFRDDFGELRASGYVRQDQLFFMARCGFNSFELNESDFESAAVALSTFSAAYQPSNDAGLAYKLASRLPAGS